MRQLGRLAPGSGFAIIAGALLISYWLRDLAPGTLRGLAWGPAAARREPLVFAFLVRYRFDESRFDRWEMGYAALTGSPTGPIWGLLAWMPIPDPEHNRLSSSSSSAVLHPVGQQQHTGGEHPRTLELCGRAGDPSGCTHRDPGWRSGDPFSLGLLVTGGVTVLAVRSHRSSLMAAMLDRHEAATVLQQRVIFESAGEGIVFPQSRNPSTWSAATGASPNCSAIRKRR